MISRSQSKVDEKLKEISNKYPKIETIGVECDFSKLTTLKEYRNFVDQSPLKELDIAVLCLNAGIMIPGPIDLVDDKRFEDVYRVNALQVIYLLKALSKKLLSRDKRCGVLVVSS